MEVTKKNVIDIMLTKWHRTNEKKNKMYEYTVKTEKEKTNRIKEKCFEIKRQKKKKKKPKYIE